MRFLILLAVVLVGCGKDEPAPPAPPAPPSPERTFFLTGGGDCGGKPCIEINGYQEEGVEPGALKRGVQVVLDLLEAKRAAK